MNFERGFPIPQNGNEDSWSSVTHGMPIPQESGIEHSHGSWTATSGGNETVGDGDARVTPRRPIPMDNGTVRGPESWTTINPEQPTPKGNGVTEDRNSWNPTVERTVLQRNDWKSVIPGNPFPNRNGIGHSRNSWSPVTPEKVVNQRSNTENGMESENWQDLIGMYTGLLKEDTVDRNGVKDINPTPSSEVRDYGNQNWVASTNKNVTPRPSPSPYRNQTSYLKTNDPANWNSDLLAKLVGSQNSSTSANEAQTKGNHVSNRSANQVESSSMRSTSWTSMLGSQQTLRFTSNNLINDANNTKDGFPVAYQPGYKPSSPPRSAGSSITDSFPFAPITPDHQRKHMNSQRVPENGNFRVEGTSTPAKNSHENQTVSREDAENLYNELLQTIGDSPPSAISTTQKELGVPENRDEQGIDLNKTPQQKTPTRRKKHRPKVIREGKPKRAPKPKDPNNVTPNETRVKRKYVRKKGINISETQGDDVTKNTPVGSVGKRKYVRKKGIEKFGSEQKTRVDDVATSKSCKKQLNFDLEPEPQDESCGHRSSQQDIDANVETPAKSCKKQLKFDLEPVTQDESYGIRSSQEGRNVNSNPQNIEQERRINSTLARAAIEIAQQHKSMQSELNVPTTPLANAKHHALNVLARNMTIRNSIPEQDRRDNMYNKVNQRFHGEGIENVVFQAGMVSTNLERVREPNLVSTTPQSFASKSMLNLDERRGIKRQNPDQMCLNANEMDSLLLYQKLLLGVAHRAYDRNNLGNVLLENSKKTKMQSEFQTLVSSDPSCIIPHMPRQETRQMNGIYGNGSAMHLLTSSTERVHPSYKAMNVGGNVINGQFRPPPMAATHYLQKHQVLSGMQHHGIRSVPERSQNYIQGYDIRSKTAIMSWNLPPPTPSKDASRYAVTAYPATLLEKRQTAKQNPYNQRLNGLNQMFQQHRNDPLKSYQQPTPVARGRPRKQKAELSVDDITYMLNGLHIYDGNKKDQHELVLYRGSNALIPFEPIKKRIPRPKVDLDPETDRLWKLLMGKEGSEGTETLENGKEKWWEEERRVFRGRADSFIARMHLVQGDRRFSRWKGSVVDSVIGVFLTQNVSDHLSSSAFMSLAAKFPPKSSTTKETCCQDRACEKPIEVEEPNDIIKCHEKIKQPVSDQSLFVTSKSSEDITHQISSTRDAANKQSGISVEEVVLSQDSFDSSTTQTVDEIRSSSGSNSEADDVTTGFETSKQSDPPVNLIQEKDHSCHDNWSTLLDEPKTSIHDLPKESECSTQIPKMNGVDLNSSSSFTPTNSSIHLLQESFVSSDQHQMCAAPDPQKAGLLHFAELGKESTSSLPSSNSEITEACHTSNVTYSENGMPKLAESSQGQDNLPSSHPVHQENFQPGPPVCSSQVSNTDHPQIAESFKETTTHGETHGKNGAQKQDSPMFEGIASLVNKQISFKNTVPESKTKEQKEQKEQNYSSHEPPSGAGTNMSKAQKRKAEDERNRTFDWDSLRKEALSNGEKGERSRDATDSLDYEALRRAHVSEISDAIRERGMNNLLADRIKDFLNRLVRDHGKIDLEWLRDAPPDKAKEYLLSVRGLGLKSVECVRLLTLHHLAFPVDTNVGRIAVRLGWVPLQPLPESLQLHLLEMYPVLESIQKYLWPRLCKLDQLTLYELHYQMITFGKVFCTKSKPNCNACPMRAECRHFASAFASARLALPGPEEKGIVTSDAPVATDPIPPVVIRPMSLPQAENDFNKSETSFGRNCEPIIEEPTTPEPEAAELSISDIEDQYYEDSDEIPSIKLNMEEFTTNLQSIMQDSTEFQDDMSKALVALNPNAASIPTPKLKDVSRLRTEHQVYELPDSHRLLEGLDKREPDDPSPYLLAIWTPGETANSEQPPERECSAQQSGKLCDRTTCFSCNNIKEANSQVVRGTILIPCRTAMRGSFPLNGTYFQVNEMFADHESSMKPIDVPRTWIWNLPRRTVYFGTSVSTIFKGLTTGGIQYCFWKGFVCVRGFDRKTRAPRPLMARLHFPASKVIQDKKRRQINEL